MRRNPRAGARKSGGFRLEVFTDDELREIHGATLEVLSRTGVFVEDEEALQIFEDGGADVDRERRTGDPEVVYRWNDGPSWADVILDSDGDLWRPAAQSIGGSTA